MLHFKTVLHESQFSKDITIFFKVAKNEGKNKDYHR